MKSKRNKKYNPNKISSHHKLLAMVNSVEDKILPMEHMAGQLSKPFSVLTNALVNNKLTIDILINEIIFIYRMIFVYQQLEPDVYVGKCMLWIENEFNKLGNLETSDELKAIKQRKIKVHWTMRDELIALCECIKECILSIKSKNEYAKIYREALILSNMRMSVCARAMLKFVDLEATREYINLCDKRIEREMLINYNINLGKEAVS